MNCRKVQSLVSAYVDCELSGMEMLSIRQHLSGCSQCQEEVDDTLRLKRAFGSMGATRPAEGLALRITSRLDEVTVPRYMRVLTSMRRRFTLPERRVFAKVSLGIVAMLLVFRSGAANMNSQYLGAPILTASGNQQVTTQATASEYPMAGAGSIKWTAPGKASASFPGSIFVENMERGAASTGGSLANFFIAAH